MMAMSMDLAELDMRAAVDYLAAHEGFEGTGVGSLGSCLGGGLSVWAATANQRVDAVVTYYYLMPHGKPDFTRIDAPLLGHFGTADEFVAVDDARALEQEMESAGVSVRFEFYEGAGHAFFNDTDRLGTYDPQAAERSWELTVEFLRSNLA